MEKYFDLLKSLSLFENINASDIPRMLNCLHATVRPYKKDSYIRYAGDTADFIGIVLEGHIQILIDNYDGRRNITATFGSGQMFAEAFACADITSLPADIFAVTDCAILFLNKNQILHQCENVCDFHSHLIQNLLKIVARKNLLLNQKLRILSHNTTREKIMAYLNEQARIHHSNEFTIPYNRQALADYLGVERSAMSAEISKLQKQGLLETNRSHFKLLF